MAFKMTEEWVNTIKIVVTGIVVLVVVLVVYDSAQRNGVNSQPVIDKESKVVCYYRGANDRWQCYSFANLTKLDGAENE